MSLKSWVVLCVWVWIPIFGLAEEPQLPYGPVVVPLVLDEFEPSCADQYLRIEYRAAPNARVLAIEEAEKVWFFNDVAVLILGSTGNIFPPQVSSRAMAWVRLFDGDSLVDETPIHPRRDGVRMQSSQDGMLRALKSRLTGVDATYIAQVANYLAGNSATLDVVGSTYWVDSAGMVIDASGQWVGAPTGYWTQSAAGSLWTAKDSNRGWYGVAMSADGTIQTAVVHGMQIYVSTDSGNSWTAKDSYRSWRGVAMSADGTIQTAVVSWGEIYVSTDSGDTWTAKDSPRDWLEVAMSADGTIQTAVALGGQIYVSTDSGDTWTAKDSPRDWRGVAMSADGTIQTAVVSGGQIYVSLDSGDTFTAKDSSRIWIDVAMSADGTIQTAVDYGGQIYVSTDSGDTWTAKDSSRQWYGVAMSADGTIQTAVVLGGQIYVSLDSGDTWTAKDSNRGWYGVAMSADGTIQTAVDYGGKIFVSHPNIGVETGVGIGILDPELGAHLHVQGKAIIDSNINITATNYSIRRAPLLVGNPEATATLIDGNQIELVDANYLYLNLRSSSGVVLCNGGGNVGIGVVPISDKLEVSGNATIDGDLTITGSCTGCASDLALKQNLMPLDRSLDKVLHLTGYSFDWSEQADREAAAYPGPQIGVIAQEVEQVFPELVGIDSRGYKFIRYQKLVVPLIEAVKDLNDQNSVLSEQNAVLREDNDRLNEEMKERDDALQKRIEALEEMIDF